MDQKKEKTQLKEDVGSFLVQFLSNMRSLDGFTCACVCVDANNKDDPAAEVFVPCGLTLLSHPATRSG